MIKVAIVDDHKMFRDGIAYILNSTEGYDVIWTAENSKSTKENLKVDFPDILLLDISLNEESGIDITGELVELYPDITILGLTMHHEQEYVIKMMENGAKGFLLKDSGIDELKKAIEKVQSGDFYYNELVLNSLVTNVRKPEKGDIIDKSILTKRELEILSLTTEEFSNQEISEKLFISIRTVETHKRNMISKLNVKSSIGLVRYAVKFGLMNENSK